MKNKLENVAINDVLPLKAARCDAIAKLESCWNPGTLATYFDGFIYIHCAVPPIGWHQCHLPPSIWLSLSFIS